MAETIAHRELRNNSSEILRRVQSGESFNITNHGEIVAVLIPPEASVVPALRWRKATAQGHFEDIPFTELDHPIQETLDYLRGDR